MFYIILFCALAGLLVFAGATAMSRNRTRMESEDRHHPSETKRRNRKAQRAQSRSARRKRH